MREFHACGWREALTLGASTQNTALEAVAVEKAPGILLIRLKSMGDVLFTLPATHAFRQAFPQAHLAFLVSKEYAPLLSGFRDISSVIELDRSRFRGMHPWVLISEATMLLRQLRRERLGLAVDFQGYGETAFLTWASGARERWGTVYRQSRKWAYTRAVPRNLKVHPAEEFLTFLPENSPGRVSVKNEFVLAEKAMREAGDFFSAAQLKPEHPTVFIQPFTSAPVKNWPLDRYLAVARHWQGRHFQILFGGGPGDRAALEPARQAGFTVSAGVPLLTSAGLVKLSTFMLGGDTGLLHLGVAMGRRVLMLMRSVLPGSTHPFRHKDWAIPPKAEGVISTITTETVIERCTEVSAELGVPV